MANPRRIAFILAAALALPGPASASVIVDTFSAGSFSLTGGSPGSSVTVSCGFTCLGGSRDVFVTSTGGGFVQLSTPPHEAQSAISDAGGQLRFTYTVAGASGMDITGGGANTDLLVKFTAYAAGAAARVTIEDTGGTSAAFEQSPAGPGVVLYHLSIFGSVNLAQVRTIELTITSPAAGDYHVDDIRVADPGAVAPVTSITGDADNVTAGGPGAYPSDPPIGFHAEYMTKPTVDIPLRLQDVSGDAGGTVVEVPASVEATLPMSPCTADNPCDPVLLTTRFQAHPPDPVEIIHHFDFVSPETMESLRVQKVHVSWETGHKVLSAGAEVEVLDGNIGLYQHMLFAEVPPTQPGVITNVTAMPGSMSLSITMSGVDPNEPVLWTSMSGSYTPSAAVPAVGPAGLIVLSLLILVLGASLLVLRRRADAGRS